MEKTIEDNSKESEYVVDGAKLRCSLGCEVSKLKMVKSHGVFLKGKAQCNVKDNKGNKNIISFGLCKKEMVCKPELALPWINNKETTLIIEEEKALIKDAQGFCIKGGIIIIEESGQK